MFKRLFDIVAGCSVIIVLSPVVVLIALLISIRLGQPIFFSQRRPGLHGKPFTIYKLRTMTDERDADGNLLPDAERLTRLGRFLRSTSLDELPELLNVLKGDMSLVGPRPLMMSYLERYTPEQARRHDVKPGITGWAQIKGRDSLTWEEKFTYDLWYVDNQSLFLDIWIILQTIWIVLKREGISAENHPTMPEFLGSQASVASTKPSTDTPE